MRGNFRGVPHLGGGACLDRNCPCRLLPCQRALEDSWASHPLGLVPASHGCRSRERPSQDLTARAPPSLDPAKVDGARSRRWAVRGGGRSWLPGSWGSQTCDRVAVNLSSTIPV